MPSISIEGLPSAAPAAESWPRNELGDDTPLGLQADEMFARRLDTGFAGEVRSLVHDPATGLAGRDPEAALAGIAETIPRLAELKDRYLAQARGPRQKALLEPLIDRRLDRAGGDLGRIVEQATSVLDDRIVAERLADLARDAALAWQDPAHLRLLGHTTVDELRYQGERKGWDASRTDAVVRTGLSDLYAGAVEAALGQDPERAATLYIHARDVIQPERQAAVERKIEQAREERRVTEILGGLADTPDDPTRRPDLDDYQARAAEATPQDASPEVRAQVTRMARIEQARADRAWQAARGRAATGALDWLGANPAAPLMAMPADLRDGLSAEQREALDRTAMNGGRVVTDRELYDTLDDQAVSEPERFAAIDLTQYRLSLGDSDYTRLTKLQQALAEGKPDPAFERHRLGRLFLGEGLRAANLDPDGEEARTARQQLDRLLGAFESIEGKPPTMADIRGLVGDVLPRGNGDPNIVRVGGEPLAEPPVDIASVEPAENSSAAQGRPALDTATIQTTDTEPTDDSSPPPFAGDPNIILANGGNNSSRRSGGGQSRTPIEEMRASNFEAHREALARLEPKNPALTQVATPGYTPSRDDVMRMRQELLAARARVAGSSLPSPVGAGETLSGGVDLPGGGRLERPLGIPKEWRMKMSDKQGGVIYFNPNNTGDQVRVMPGNPRSPYPHQQRPYVIDQNWGAYVNRDGRRIEGANPRKHPDTHIPYDIYLFWR